MVAPAVAVSALPRLPSGPLVNCTYGYRGYDGRGEYVSINLTSEVPGPCPRNRSGPWLDASPAGRLICAWGDGRGGVLFVRDTGSDPGVLARLEECPHQTSTPVR
jgi:hypothetical protein